MPKLDLDAIPQTNATGYPAPFDREVEGRWYRRLAPAGGTDRIRGEPCGAEARAPGRRSATGTTGRTSCWSCCRARRCWSRTTAAPSCAPAMSAAWPKGSTNGHHLRNDQPNDCCFVVISGGERGAGGGYSDIDMVFTEAAYFRRDGTPYPTKRLA